MLTESLWHKVFENVSKLVRKERDPLPDFFFAFSLRSGVFGREKRAFPVKYGAYAFDKRFAGVYIMAE